MQRILVKRLAVRTIGRGSSHPLSVSPLWRLSSTLPLPKETARIRIATKRWLSSSSKNDDEEEEEDVEHDNEGEEKNWDSSTDDHDHDVRHHRTWEQNFQALKEHVAALRRERSIPDSDPAPAPTDDFLRTWLSRQRHYYKLGRFGQTAQDKDRIDMLESIGGEKVCATIISLCCSKP